MREKCGWGWVDITHSNSRLFWGGEGAVDVEFCTCAGSIRHTFPRSIAEHHPTDSPTKRNSTPPPAETLKPVRETKVNDRLAQLWPAPFCPVLCQPLFFIHVLQACQKKLSAATDPTYPNGSERKPRTHLLTSKGMVLFARFTGGWVLEKKMLQARGNHSAFLSATGCSSVPGWRQLRTLCKTRLAESYFLFALILFPQSSWHRYLACVRFRSKILKHISRIFKTRYKKYNNNYNNKIIKMNNAQGIFFLQKGVSLVVLWGV